MVKQAVAAANDFFDVFSKMLYSPPLRGSAVIASEYTERYKYSVSDTNSRHSGAYTPASTMHRPQQ